MHTTDSTTPTGSSTPEDDVVLIEAGRDAWRAIDTRYPLSDARCLLAYVERSAGRYLVLSLIPPLGGITEADTLAEAGEVAQRLRPTASTRPPQL
jgi:hypothetical protein